MKNKRDKKELTSLILTALILGGGCLYGPVAEATDPKVVDENMTTINASNNTYKMTCDTSNKYVTGNGNPMYVPIIINGVNNGTNGLTAYSFYGEYAHSTSASGFGNITLNGGTLNNFAGCYNGVNGAFYNKAYIHHNVGTGTVYNDVTVNGDVYGGHSSGNVTNNTVEINQQTGKTVTVTGNVYGGKSTNGSAGTGQGTGNSVTINGGNIVGSIYGGYSDSKDAFNNSVTLGGTTTKKITIGGNVVGGRAGQGRVTDSNSVILQGTAQVAGYMYGGARRSDSSSDDVPINIISGYNDGNVLYLDGSAQGNIVTGTVAGFTNFVIKNNFTFKPNTTSASAILKAGTMNVNFLDFYNNASTLRNDKDSAGTMTLLLSDTNMGGNFYIFPDASKSTMVTLQAGIAGKDTYNVTSFSGAKYYTNPSDHNNSLVLTHSGTHVIKYPDQKHLNYVITNNLTAVDLSKWDGTTATVPTGWTKGTSAVSVSGTVPSAAVSDVTAGNSKDILTTTTSDLFTGATGLPQSTTAFSENLATGVDITGNKVTGVQVTDSGKKLTYYNAVEDKNNMTGVTLGAMTWGQAAASASGYKFTNTASINDSNLSFTFTDAQKVALNQDSSMTLLTGATNLAASTGASREQNITSSTTNGAALSGTLKGKVSSASGTVNYNVDSMTLNTIGLNDWDGSAGTTGTAVGNLPSGWTAKTGGVTVDTGNFSVTPDTNIDIFTTTTANFFKDDYITGAKKYNPTQGSETKAEGLTISYDEGSGVRASEDGKKLYYQIDGKEATAVSLGNMTWGTGASGADYKFVGGASGTSIDAAELNLTTDQALATDAEMVLLSDASGLTTTNPVTNGNSKTVSIDNTDANGINFNATATGAVTAAANEVDFAVSGVTLDSIDLAGWNGTNTSTVPTGWTKASPINVAGEFTKPTLEPGASRDILSSEADLFSDAAIDAAIAYATGGSFSDEEAGVTLAGDKAGGVKSTDSGRKLTYYGEKYDTSTVSLGQMTWGTPREATSAYDFAGVTAIDATNLSFTNPLAVGTTASLLTNANNLAAGLPITYASGTSHTQSFTGTAVDNGVKLAGTINGTVSTSAGQVDYTVDSKSITGADLSGWDSTKEAQSLAGWSSSFATGSISTSGLKAPELKAGASMDILTSSTDNFFNDDYIADDGHKYGPAGPSSSDTANGVTFTGNQEKGVKTEDTGKKLVYAAGDMAVTDISLGNMKVGDGGIVNKRTADNHYLFDNNTKIDATSLTFDKPADVVDSTLVSGATGITSSNPVTGASHSQAITNAAMGGGITVSGTLNGTVSAVDGGVNYAVKNKTVSSMDLSGWDGTENTTLPDNKWTGNNVSVNTGAFAAPDADKTVFTTNIDNFFGTVTGDRAYRDNDPFAGDEEKGVALSGTISGGVKASDDGKNLNYYAQSLNTNTVTLGQMDWGTGRSMGTGYTFDKVGANGVDASALNLTFNNDEINTIKAGDHWNLLTDASGLKADLTVKGSPVSQKLSYGISKVADLKGTLTGNVTTAVNTVQYNVTTKTLDQVDISSWDGSTTGTQLDSSWTSNDDGIAVTGSGFNAPTTVGEYNILTRNKAGFFAGAQIDDSIKYQPSGTYSESENNISISGQQAKGVLATTDGKSLQYKLGEAYIDTIGLGQLTYAKGAVLMDKSSAMYNYSNVKTLDTSGFALTLTEDQKKTAKDADSMTLLKGNSTLGDIASQDAGTEKYTYTVNPGLTVEADIKTSLSATGGSVLYTVDSNTASDLKFGKLGWNSSTYVRPDSEIAYSTAVVNSENMYFTGVSTLAKNAKMQLVSNFGDSINRARAGIFTLDNGKTGKGHAYWDSSDGSLWYVVDRGVDEQVAPVEAVKVETTIDGENPHKGDVPGGKAEGDGEAKDNETKVKNSHIQKNDDGTGGNANGGTSENGDADNNKLDVEESEIDGDANGGTSDTGNTEENEVIIKRGTIHGTVTGGETLGGPGGSKGNTTTMEDSTVDGDVNGGKTGGSGNTEENHVILTGSKVGGDVNGGHSGGSGGSKGNETTLDGTEVGGDVNGGKTDGDGETKENKVDIKNGSKIGGNVTGGRSGGNGDSTDNETSVEGQSQVDGDVTGGQSEKGNANKNETTVTEGSKVGGDVTGGKSNGDGTSNENKTTVSGGSEIGGNVVGGYSKNGDTNQNETTVTGGSKVEKDVIGGQNEGKGTSNENKATVDGSTVGGSVTGGQSETGSTDKNETKVGGKSKVTGDVTGGKTNGDGTSSENKTTVEGGSEVGGSVVGGQSESGNTDKNEVSVTDGSIVNGSVSGGKTTGSGSANNNTVSIDSSTIKGSLSGGDSTGGSASGNTVTVNNATIGTDGTTDGNIYGGKTLGVNKAADTNTVSLTGGKVNGGVFGGYSENGSAANNSVTVNGTTIRDYIYGGKSKYLSQNDEVYFKNGSVMGIIGGGCEESLNNLAELTDGTVEEHVLGGFATGTDGVAKGNKVQMTGGTVKGSVIGGYGNGTADGNTIYLSGGTVNGADIDSKILNVGEIKGGVYGGYSKDGSTKNNKVNLYGTADVSATGLFGGNQEATGNVLTIGRILDDGTRTAWTGGGQSVKNIKNFESLDFSVVPWSTNQSGIRISDGTNSDLSMTTVSAKQVAFTGVDSLTVNDTMTLLDQSAAANKATAVTADSRYTLGTVGEGTGTLSLDDNNNVIYKVNTVKASDQTHNTVMNSSLDMTVLSAGNEFIGSALEGLALPENIGDDGVSVFAKLGGGKMRQDTGSHIDTHTWNAILALGTKNDKKKSSMEYGAFFEYGTGGYATFNGNNRGDGDARYTGGGLLGKWQKKDGLYVEGSFRAGTVHNAARNLLWDALGNPYSYETDSSYWGVHVGVGKEFAVKGKDKLDLYAKYFYNHRGSVSFDAGGHYDLDAVSSKVLRLGTRYTMQRDKWSIYGGVAIDHEFGGKAAGLANGVAIRGADISGTSFRGEIGATVKPDANAPVTVDFNLTGFAGKKRGLSGGVSVAWHF